jgi:hypothetical protein
VGLLLIAPLAVISWPTSYVVGISARGIDQQWVRFILWAVTVVGGALIGAGISALRPRR